MKKNAGDAASLLTRRAAAAAQAPALSGVMRGTLRERYVRCGKPGCHCQKGRGHGPFVYLSVTLGVGETAQITIAAEDYETARRLIANYDRAQQAIEAVSDLNRELLKRRLLPRKQRGSPARRRGRGKDT